MQPPYQLSDSIPFAAVLNPTLANTQRYYSIVGKQSFYQGVVSGYPGDPYVKQNLKCGNLLWVNMTEVQKWWYQQAQLANALPADPTSLLESIAGPDEPWNFSYAQWGLVPGSIPDPNLIQATVLTPQTNSDGSITIVAVTGFIK